MYCKNVAQVFKSDSIFLETVASPRP